MTERFRERARQTICRRRAQRRRSPAGREFAREDGAGRSCLNLRPVLRRGPHCERGRLPPDHRHFVAAIQSGALITVLMNLVGKILMSGDSESQAREEFWNASEQTDASDSVLFRLSKKRLDQASAATVALTGRIDGNRTNFGQVHAIEVKRAASDNASVVLKHDEIADVLADLRQRARQQSAVAGVGRDESVNLFGIWQDSFTRAHELPCAAAGLA